MAVALPTSFAVSSKMLRSRTFDQGADWRIAEQQGFCGLVIPKLDQNGFEISVVADADEVTVFSEYLAHEHFTSDGVHERVVQMAMGLVRDLLSPAMRLRVTEAEASAFEIFAVTHLNHETRRVFERSRLAAIGDTAGPGAE